MTHLNILMKGWKLPKSSSWWTALDTKCEINRHANRAMIEDESVPLNYYTAFDQLEKMIPENATIVSEGANTMDIGRTMMNNRLQRFILTTNIIDPFRNNINIDVKKYIQCII